METFYFFIPLEVISSMGLTHDGETVSKQVRLGDLFADGTISSTQYLAQARAGVVWLELPQFTFYNVQEEHDGWVCTHFEPEPLAWPHTRQFLLEVFPGGNAWDKKPVALPYYVQNGGLYVNFESTHPEAVALARAGWANPITRWERPQITGVTSISDLYDHLGNLNVMDMEEIQDYQNLYMQGRLFPFRFDYSRGDGIALLDLENRTLVVLLISPVLGTFTEATAESSREMELIVNNWLRDWEPFYFVGLYEYSV